MGPLCGVGKSEDIRQQSSREEKVTWHQGEVGGDDP